MDVVLELYLERCKYRHALAFCQFRKILPNAKLSDLQEMFDGRKSYMIRLLDVVKSLTRDFK